MKAYFSIKFVIFIVFSVLIIVLRDTLLINLKYLVAALLLAFGTENIIFHAIFHKKDCIRKYQFIYGFIQLILGFTVLFGVDTRRADGLCRGRERGIGKAVVKKSRNNYMFWGRLFCKRKLQEGYSQ